MNKTLQDRLVKELREAGIPHTHNREDAIKEANTFLETVFLPKFNTQFSLSPRSPSNLHIPLTEVQQERISMHTLLTEKKSRKVQNDYTLRYEGKIVQLYRKKE
jgi:hypothetical protein